MGTVHEWVLTRQHYWPNEVAHLRHQLLLDARAATVNTGRSIHQPDHAY
jgi:hypothetical protein